MSEHKQLHIKWLEDYHDCDTCGGNWATGAEVTLNGEVLLNKVPKAHCFGGEHYTSDEIYLSILDKLEYKVEEDNGF